MNWKEFGIRIDQEVKLKTNKKIIGKTVSNPSIINDGKDKIRNSFFSENMIIKYSKKNQGWN